LSLWQQEEAQRLRWRYAALIMLRYAALIVSRGILQHMQSAQASFRAEYSANHEGILNQRVIQDTLLLSSQKAFDAPPW